MLKDFSPNLFLRVHYAFLRVLREPVVAIKAVHNGHELKRHKVVHEAEAKQKILNLNDIARRD